MSRDWASDRFVRLYTDETEDDLLLSWEARAVWNELLKRFDKRGQLVARKGARTIAALIRYPVEVVEQALPDLLEDGRLERVDDGFRAPNYKAANYTPRSSATRKADERTRTQIGSLPVEVAVHADTREHDKRELDNKMSRDVTSSHTESRAVTKVLRSDQISTDHAQIAPARARRTTISEDWLPPEPLRIRAEELELDWKAETREFVAYWRGEGKPKVDWDETFRARIELRGEQRRRDRERRINGEVREIPDL